MVDVKTLQNLRRVCAARPGPEFGPTPRLIASMAHNSIASNGLAHNATARDAMTGNAMAHHAVMHDPLARDAMALDTMGRAAVGRDAMACDAIGLDQSARGEAIIHTSHIMGQPYRNIGATQYPPGLL